MPNDRMKGTQRGQSIVPLYPSVVEAVQNDEKLYEMLAMVDAIRSVCSDHKPNGIRLDSKICGKDTQKKKKFKFYRHLHILLQSSRHFTA